MRQIPQLMLNLLELTLHAAKSRSRGKWTIALQLRKRQVHGHKQLTCLIMQRMCNPLGLLLEHFVEVAQPDHGFAVSAVRHLIR